MLSAGDVEVNLRPDESSRSAKLSERAMTRSSVPSLDAYSHDLARSQTSGLSHGHTLEGAMRKGHLLV
jgi:hypothetical protein